MQLIDLSQFDDATTQVDTFLDGLCSEAGFDYASYATMSSLTGDVQGYANYPEAWKSHYTDQQYHRFDPTILKAARSVAPVDWARFDGDDKFDTVLRDATDFGISRRGISVPVRGPYGDCGLLNVTRMCSDREWSAYKPHVMGQLQMAAVHVHDNVMSSGILAKTLRHPTLSDREREILQWVAQGKSQQDIGDILAISHRTVEVHIRSGRQKLGALTTAQAIGRAISLGLIYPG